MCHERLQALPLRGKSLLHERASLQLISHGLHVILPAVSLSAVLPAEGATLKGSHG